MTSRRLLQSCILFTLLVLSSSLSWADNALEVTSISGASNHEIGSATTTPVIYGGVVGSTATCAAGTGTGPGRGLGTVADVPGVVLPDARAVGHPAVERPALAVVPVRARSGRRDWSSAGDRWLRRSAIQTC